MVMLEVEDLVGGYIENEPVLKRFCFSMGKGEFVGVVGPNGSGKSTFLRALTDVLKFWKGKIELKGKDISELSREQIARTISVVPQDTYISFPYSVEEIVLMGRSPYLSRFEYYGKKDLEIARKYMNITRTYRFKDEKINELSGGEMQRVIMARALTQKPELLLMDEATSHLDIGHKKAMMDTVKNLNETRNLNVISVNHNLNLVSRYCEKLLLMDDGKCHAYGTPEEVLTEANIHSVYGIDVEVHRHPMDGNLYISPMDRTIRDKDKGKKVHLVCGGGSSRSLFKKLIEKGYEVTAGVLNVMDSDLAKAEALDINCVNEAPFSPISKSSLQKNLEMIKKADVVVVTDFPIGEGNIRNLEAVRDGITDETDLILVNIDKINERDFTEENMGVELYADISNKMDFKSVDSTEGVAKLL